MISRLIFALLFLILFIGTVVVYSGAGEMLGQMSETKTQATSRTSWTTDARLVIPAVPSLEPEAARVDRLEARHETWLNREGKLQPELESVGRLVAERIAERERLEVGRQRHASSEREGEREREPPKPKVFAMGETIRVGYTSYVVWRAWWVDRLTGGAYSGLNVRPDAHFLFIELTVRNDDPKPRSIPPFRLIDDKGREYQTSSKAWAVEKGFGVLDSLNPTVLKQGVIVFDVPKERQYCLKVLGGYWSSAEALIGIEPKLQR